MSAYGMHPTFNDKAGYDQWRSQWLNLRRGLLARQKAHSDDPAASQENAVMLEKMNGLRETARTRWKRIEEMKVQLAAQNAQFPLVIENIPSVDFHFNKISLEFPFMPMWTVKAKGRSYYLDHVDFNAVGTTRETPEHPATKGAIRFRHVTLSISADGTAELTRRAHNDLAQAA